MYDKFKEEERQILDLDSSKTPEKLRVLVLFRHV